MLPVACCLWAAGWWLLLVACYLSLSCLLLLLLLLLSLSLSAVGIVVAVAVVVVVVVVVLVVVVVFVVATVTASSNSYARLLLLFLLLLLFIVVSNDCSYDRFTDLAKTVSMTITTMGGWRTADLMLQESQLKTPELYALDRETLKPRTQPEDPEAARFKSLKILRL